MAGATRAPIQTMWVGKRLTQMEHLALASFVAHGHTVHLYAYSLPESEVPAGVELRDAREVLPEDQIFTYGPSAGPGNGSMAAFSNVFRYKLLLDRGGWWVDTDVVCVRPFPDRRAVVAAERYPDKKVIAASCAMCFPPGSDVMRYCLDEANAVDKATLKYSEIGPKLVNRAIQKFGQRRLLAHPDEFCPIDWFTVEKLVQPGVTVPRRAYAVHLWNEMWRRAGMDKSQPPPEGSLVHRLLYQYSIAD